MKKIKSNQIEELLKEISELKVRATKIGYKNIIPKLPQSGSEQSMLGFLYRLDNWKKQLLQLENPGGLPSGKKPIKSNDLRQFVINNSLNVNLNDDISEDE